MKLLFALILAVAVGHEYRQDDMPSIAAAPDGSLWVTWLSFAGDRDDVALRRWQNGKWSNLHWVPATGGDNWLPQVMVDAASRPWAVWSGQVNGNWDVYARRFDPAGQEWGALERLTTDPLPDINPRVWSDGKGRGALVWQGFRGHNSNIFLRTFDGERWGPEVRVTSHAANDWMPAVALDGKGNAWVVYDTYQNGSYDVYLARVAGGEVQTIPVATTPRHEVNATVASDTLGRVWVAWEEGPPGWGKDNGFVIRDTQPGEKLGADHEPHIRCYENGQWREPVAPVAAAFLRKWTYQPHVFSDGRGSVWVVALERRAEGPVVRKGKMSYYAYWASHLEGDRWSEAVALPNSKGRSSTGMGAALNSAGELWMAWPTDNRSELYYHRPLRQQVYAGQLPSKQAPPPVLQPVAQRTVDQLSGHPDEPGDIRAVRAYTATSAGKIYRIYRGDFHRHTELSWDGGGGGDGNLQDLYRYMIDVAALDFGASTDHQGGGFPYWWWYSQKMTDMYHAPGAYVPIFGYERSVGFPNSHRNVFFASRPEARVTPFFMRDRQKAYELPITAEGAESQISMGPVVANDTKLLWEEVRERGGITIPHTTGTLGGTDWRDNDRTLEPVVEIYQGARTSYEQMGAPYVLKDATGVRIPGDAPMPAGMVSNAWARGYLLGVIASSDHGSTHISYAMVYTDDPTRQGILDAIRRRHTYGAMDNIILDVRMGEHMMGDEFHTASPLPLRVYARGTRAIKHVDVIKDGKVVYSTEPKRQEARFEYADQAAVAGRAFYYVRVQQEDGMLGWSSPMFVNY